MTPPPRYPPKPVGHLSNTKAAELAGMSRRTLSSWCAAGLVPGAVQVHSVISRTGWEWAIPPGSLDVIGKRKHGPDWKPKESA